MTRKDLNCKLSNSKDEPNTESGLAASPSDSPISSERHPEKTVTALVQHIRQLEKALEQKEVQIKSAHTQLAHADKLATLGTMGAGIAHELNNPLTVISAEADEILDAVREGYDDIDLTMLSVRNIKNCAERMRHIIDHIRRYARKDDDEPWQRLDINLPIQDSLIILKPQIENSGIVVNLSLTQNLPKIWGHPSRLESVFQNLIANARDAFNHVQDGRAKHLTIRSTHEAGGYIRVEFEDNACGMSDEVRKKIFDPFYTTKEMGRGTGLGLAITLDHIHEHQATLTLDSKENEGTKFTLKFPLERRGGIGEPENSNRKNGA